MTMTNNPSPLQGAATPVQPKAAPLLPAVAWRCSTPQGGVWMIFGCRERAKKHQKATGCELQGLFLGVDPVSD